MGFSPRSILCIPASQTKMLEKGLVLGADQLLIDLEDSVTEGSKVQARENIKTWAALLSTKTSKKISVRINEFGSTLCTDDLKMISEGVAPFLHSIMVPKVNDRKTLDSLDSELSRIEKANNLEVGAIEIEAQIESAMGLINVAQIASHPRVSSLSFGPIDFMASISMPSSKPGFALESVETALQFPLLQIVIAAHAFGKAAYDGPCVSIDGLSDVEKQSEIARALGCDGKWVIHPSHIDTCNKAFTPSAKEIADAQALVSKLAESAQLKSGAAAHDGLMIDEASRKIALRVLEKAKLYLPDIEQ